jgi:type IV pilus assembly protein PilP
MRMHSFHALCGTGGRWASLAIRIALVGLLGTLLTGCGRSMDDLERYTEQIQARKPGRVEPLPEVKPYQPFEYQAENRRDPFDSSVIAATSAKAGHPTNPDLTPDPTRPPEFLETFPLDSLRMVGTMEQGTTLWALIKTPDSTIQRVVAGNHLGQNFGKIEHITDAGIELTEIIPDGFGGWRERGGFIALSE